MTRQEQAGLGVCVGSLLLLTVLSFVPLPAWGYLLFLGFLFVAAYFADRWIAAEETQAAPSSADGLEITLEGWADLSTSPPVSISATHLHVGGKAIRLRDLVHVNLCRSSLRVVDRGGQGHQVWQGVGEPSPRIRALARQLTLWVRGQNGMSVSPLALGQRAVLRVARRAARRCPYCHDALAVAEAVCDRCGTAHHAECYREHGACSILGCAPARPERAAA